MIKKSLTERMSQPTHNLSIKRIWKEMRKNRRIVLIDLALLLTIFFLIFTDRNDIFVLLVFILLIYGAFHWSLLAFVFRASFWVTVTAVLMLITILNGNMPLEEFLKLLPLTFLLFMVFAIARKRTNAEKALRASERRYRRLVKLAFEAVIIVIEEKFVFVNSQAVKLFKASHPEELLGESLGKFLHPRSFARFRKLEEELMGGDGEMVLVEEKFSLIDNTYVDIEAVGLVIQYQGKPALQFVVRDISERINAQEEVVRSARLAALGQIATALVHQVSTPLQIIQAHLEMILDFGMEPKEQKKYLHIIRQQIEYLHNTADNILKFAKPKVKPQQSFALSDVIDQVLTLTGKQLQQNQIQVELECHDVPPVWISPNLLTQVFLNLIINSIESTCVNDDNRLLHIKLGSKDDQVFASFMSNGPAISPEDLPHIFEPFFTTKPEGTGLGLWISHNLVEQNNGKLAVKNLPNGKGVVFTVSFPSTMVEHV